MPALFKIFIILLLNTLNGFGDGGELHTTGLFSVQTIQPLTLIITTDPEFSNVVANICLQNGKGSEIERNTNNDPIPTTTFTISYTALNLNERKKIMDQLEPHRSRMKMQWVN